MVVEIRCGSCSSLKSVCVATRGKLRDPISSYPIAQHRSLDLIDRILMSCFPEPSKLPGKIDEKFYTGRGIGERQPELNFLMQGFLRLQMQVHPTSETQGSYCHPTPTGNEELQF